MRLLNAVQGWGSAKILKSDKEINSRYHGLNLTIIQFQVKDKTHAKATQIVSGGPENLNVDLSKGSERYIINEPLWLIGLDQEAESSRKPGSHTKLVQDFKLIVTSQLRWPSSACQMSLVC